jgi:hypothetical protein
VIDIPSRMKEICKNRDIKRHAIFREFGLTRIQEILEVGRNVARRLV